jgi:hypothetical protein
MNTSTTIAHTDAPSPARRRRHITVASCAVGALALIATSCASDGDAADIAPPDSAPAAVSAPSETLAPITTPSAPTTEPATTVPPAPTTAAVTFELVVDISASSSGPTGDFEVSEGAEALGCSAGRLYSETQDGEGASVLAVLTCEEGPKAGEIKVRFDLVALDDSGDNFEGSWRIDGGTADFEGLEGDGELSGVRDTAANIIVQTHTGEINLAGVDTSQS